MIVKQLVLSKNDIQHLKYSPWWGLVYNADIDTTANLALDIDNLLNNPDQVTALQEQRNSLVNQYSWVRYFYYLFNISDSNRNIYRLAAYEAFIASKSNDVENTPAYYDTDTSTSLNSFEWVIDRFISLFQNNKLTVTKIDKINMNTSNHSPSPSQSQSPSPLPRQRVEEEIEIEVDDEKKLCLSEDVEKMSIVVRRDQIMMDHLKTLGITAKEGELVTLQQLNKAYRTLSLACHPDKIMDLSESEQASLKAQFFAIQKAHHYFSSSPCASPDREDENPSYTERVNYEICCQIDTQKLAAEEAAQSVPDMTDDDVRAELKQHGCSEKDILDFMNARKNGLIFSAESSSVLGMM